MAGKFYSVGVGPGDPSLMTVKAVETIENCAVIAAPESRGAENVALNIARNYINGKQIVLCEMPMTRDPDELAANHEAAADKLSAILDDGRDVAFLTLGDPSVYSTSWYVHKRLTARGYDTRVIPGVPSFCAAAASLNSALCEGDEQLHIIPSCYDGAPTGLTGTKVLMKPPKDFAALKKELLSAPGNTVVTMVERASMPDEKICNNIENAQSAGYFSIIIAK